MIFTVRDRMRSRGGEVLAQPEARHRRWVGAVTKPYFGAGGMRCTLGSFGAGGTGG